MAVARDFADFVLVVHGVDGEAVFARTDEDGVFALMHGDGGDADAIAVFERFQQEGVGLFGFLVGKHEVRSVEIDRVDLILFDEGDEFHDGAGARRDFLEFFVGDDDVLPFFVFVAFDDFAALDLTIAMRTEERLLESRVANLVELMEIHPLAARGGIELDWNREQTEGESSLPN